MKKHSLIGETEDAFHVHDGEGHFLVAKKAIAEDLHKKIRTMPKYYSGGVTALGDEAEDADPAQVASDVGPGANIPSWLMKPGADVVNARLAEASAYDKKAHSIAGPAPASVAEPVAAEAVPVDVPAVAAAPVAANPAMGMLGQIKQNTNEGVKALKEEADVIGKLGEEQAKIYEPMIAQEKAEQARLAKLQERAAQIEAENEQLFKATQENKIDPKRLWNNMSTGNKILGAFALILGGAGSGGQAENNAALKIMNQSIDNDIKAQMADSDNKRSLYQMNLQKYRDVSAAVDATKIQLNSIAQGKLAQLTARYAGPQAMAKAHGLMAQLKQQGIGYQAELLSKVAKSQADMQENYIPGYGTAKVKPSDKDREALAAAKQIRAALTELQSRAVKIGSTLPGSEADRVNKAKIAALQLQMKNAFQLGVLSGSDLEMLDRLVADPGSLRSDRAIAQLEATKQSMSALERGVLDKLGVVSQGGGKIKVSNGKQAVMIDPSDLSAAQKDGYKQVR